MQNRSIADNYYGSCRTSTSNVCKPYVPQGNAKLVTFLPFFFQRTKHAYREKGTSFYLGTTSWVLDVFTIVALVHTARAAQAGERWAAGRRGYQTIPGG